MNYLDLLGSKFVLFSLGLSAIACASAGDPVDSPRHGSGSSGTSGLNTGSGSGGSSSTSSGTGTSTGTGTQTGTAGSASTGSAGTNTSGTGGASGTAGSSGTGGSGAVTPVAMDSTFANNGYGDNGTWKGYAFTTTFPATGSTATISPVCPTPCFTTAAKQLCASGTVKMDTSFASGATLGWNINQADMMPNPVQTKATTGAGLTVNVPGATNVMRVQISAGTSQWCAPMPAGGSGTIKWGDFKTKCWEGGGTAYTAGTAIEAIQIVVPSGTMDVPFSFCLVSASIAP